MKNCFLLLLAFTLLGAACSTSKSAQTQEPVRNEVPISQIEFQGSVPIPNWKTIASRGFKLDYPPDWFAEECGLDEIIIGSGEIGSPPCGWAGPALLPAQSSIGDDGNISVGLYATEDESTDFETATKDFARDHKMVSKKSTVISNTPAVELQGVREDDGWHITEVLAPYRGKLLVAHSEIQDKASRDTFYLILSTLKFTY